jgi:hypothetical protein
MVQYLQVSTHDASLEKKKLTWQCREETENTMKNGMRPKRKLRACFLLGSNSTCRGHIAGHHFDEYEKRCNAAAPPIALNFRCIPEAVKKARREAAKSRQSLLKFPSMKMPTEFLREAILEAVARHIACDDQVCPFEVQVLESDFLMEDSDANWTRVALDADK